MPAFLSKFKSESICIFAGFRMPLHKKRSPESLWTAIKDHLPGDADDHFRTHKFLSLEPTWNIQRSMSLLLTWR